MCVRVHVHVHAHMGTHTYIRWKKEDLPSSSQSQFDVCPVSKMAKADAGTATLI